MSHDAAGGEDMGLRRLQEFFHEGSQDLGARFKRAPVAPTIFRKGPFDEDAERLLHLA